MAQHPLLNADAVTISISDVATMSDKEVEKRFASLRWADNDGHPYCPHCGCLNVYTCKRPSGLTRYRCKDKDCRKDFSVTSGTIFAWHKKPLRVYLLAIVLVCNEVKGKSMLALRRDLRVQYKTAFVLSHKLREAIAAEVSTIKLGGPGKIVQVDGVWVGKYVRPYNKKSERLDLRLAENQSGKKMVVVALREVGGRTITRVFKTEGDAVPFIREHVAPGTLIYTDENPEWNILAAWYRLKQVNHDEAYFDMGVHTNAVESFFSRFRRGENGHHHHVSGPYLHRFGQETAWREDHRYDSNGWQVDRVVELAMSSRLSVDFCGYWQRRRTPPNQTA
jgi:transposase-like protein